MCRVSYACLYCKNVELNSRAELDYHFQVRHANQIPIALDDSMPEDEIVTPKTRWSVPSSDWQLPTGSETRLKSTKPRSQVSR